VHVTLCRGRFGRARSKADIPQTSREYFGVWGEEPCGPPAYGLFARNVRGLTLHNVRFTVANPDLPGLVPTMCRMPTIQSLSVQGNPAAESVLRFTRVKDVLLSAVARAEPSGCFSAVEGDA